MKQFFAVIGGIALLVIFVILCVGLEVGGIKLNGFFQGIQKDVDHEVFKNSTAHVDGMIDDLVKYQYQFNLAKTSTEKKGIAAVVRQRFSNFDSNKVENEETKAFLEDCISGNISISEDTSSFLD